jgi:hypothetical protein
MGDSKPVETPDKITARYKELIARFEDQPKDPGQLLRTMESLFPAEAALARLTLDVRHLELQLAAGHVRLAIGEAGDRIRALEARVAELEGKTHG